MNFPTDEEYKRFIEFIETLDKDELRLCTGNCGMFALALYNTFKEGTIVILDDYSHVLIEHNGKYYDGIHIYQDLNELERSIWGCYLHRGMVRAEYNDKTIYNITEGTRNTKLPTFFENLIRNYFNE